MRTITLEQFITELKAQGVPRSHVAFVCPVCKTVQSLATLMKAAEASEHDMEIYLGFSCVGRWTNAGPHKRGHDGHGCDWTLGGLLHLHELEVIDASGTRHMRFEIATPEQARRLMEEQTSERPGENAVAAA
jgi:hypothetical protein